MLERNWSQVVGVDWLCEGRQKATQGHFELCSSFHYVTVSSAPPASACAWKV